MNPISPQTKKKAKVPSKFNKVIIFGKTKEINKEATQLTKVAKLTPFSGKVSDKYTHKIGPKENPKLNNKIPKATKKFVQKLGSVWSAGCMVFRTKKYTIKKKTNPTK